MHRRIKGSTIQGMRSPEDSLRENYQRGRLGGRGKRGTGRDILSAPNDGFSGRYKSDATDT